MMYPRTIYLVDDDEDDREFMREALTGAIDNVRVTEIHRAQNLPALLEADREMKGARLILMDLNMPGTSGMEMLRQLKADSRYRHIPVVMVSTTTHQQQINEAYAAGANAFVVKPVTSEEYANVARGVGLCFLNYRGPLRSLRTPSGPKVKTIVVVEDNDDHWQLMSIALRDSMQGYNVIRIDNKERMSTFLQHELDAIRPSVELILLDLYLPDRQEGLDLIRQIRAASKSTPFEKIPTIVFSYSDQPQDITDCYSNQASAYLIKPLDLGSWYFYFENVLDFWSNTIKPPAQRA